MPEIIPVIYLYFTEAFGRGPYSQLLSKLISSGVLGALLSWVKSYSSNCCNPVTVEGEFSRPRPLTTGIIQGNILGPTIFLLYTNNVFTILRYCTLFVFSDDIKIPWELQIHELCFTLLCTKELNRVNRWCAANQMEFSATKG